MDPLTHALTGAALINVFPVPELRRRELLFAMFVSAAPDLDLAPAFLANLPRNLIPGALLFDPKWMHVHRGMTHSLFFAVVFGLASGWIFWRLGVRKGSPARWSVFAVLALLSHVFFDLLNGGVALWSPFSGVWVSLADLPVVDPFTLGPMLLCFLTVTQPSMLWRRRGPEGSLEKTWRCFSEKASERYSARKIAACCLLFTGAAIALRLVLA